MLYRLNFYVPESHLELVKNALFDQGAGRYAAYDRCCWQVRGEGQFRPLASSQPFLGQLDQLETVVEYKVEMLCSDQVVKQVVETLLATHPYEEAAYDLYPLLSLDDL